MSRTHRNNHRTLHVFEAWSDASAVTAPKLSLGAGFLVTADGMPYDAVSVKIHDRPPNRNYSLFAEIIAKCKLLHSLQPGSRVRVHGDYDDIIDFMNGHGLPAHITRNQPGIVPVFRRLANEMHRHKKVTGILTRADEDDYSKVVHNLAAKASGSARIIEFSAHDRIIQRIPDYAPELLLRCG